MDRLFGTDGVRGIANRELTPELALDLAVAAAHILTGPATARPGADGRPRALVGRDPRASGEFLEAAVVAGLASAGVDVLRAGIVPTPGLAFLCESAGVDFGVMLSASHNPMPDNGIKLFARGGHKIDDGVEDEIERRIKESVAARGGPATTGSYRGHPATHGPRPVGAAVGRVREFPDAADRYVTHLVDTVPARFDGLRVVVDTANGAAYAVLPAAMRTLGADVIAIHSEPDGLNINDGCGSTHLDDLQHAVVAHGADAGFAVDGDADRCLAVDATGEVVDGDQILAVLAVAMRDRDGLRDDTVVATVMSNLGFLRAMDREGIAVRQTKVGDRYVQETMRRDGLVLGGEQSGHLIMADYATTGDGVLTALQVTARMAQTGLALAELAGVMTRLPQVLINVADVDKSRAATDPEVLQAVKQAEVELGGGGRVLLRPSGTEPLVRVMVEADSAHAAQRVASDLARVVERVLGAPER